MFLAIAFVQGVKKVIEQVLEQFKVRVLASNYVQPRVWLL
jgi:hypothetical protein